MKLHIQLREIQAVAVLELSGEFTEREAYASVRERVKQLLALGRKKILINLGGLRHIDSGGLGVLAEAQVAVRKGAGKLKLVNVNEEIRTLLVLTNLASLFEVHGSEEEALASFPQGGS